MALPCASSLVASCAVRTVCLKSSLRKAISCCRRQHAGLMALAEGVRLQVSVQRCGVARGLPRQTCQLGAVFVQAAKSSAAERLAAFITVRTLVGAAVVGTEQQTCT